MNTSYGFDAYKSHDLNIAMRTSSGDVLSMDFTNKKSVSLLHEETKNGSSDTLVLSSMQSFQFSMKSNGIDAQDKKEIEAFMKIAQPHIDGFLKELDAEAPKSPVSKLAHQIAEIFQPMKDKDIDVQNFTKNKIVEMVDNSLKPLNSIDRIFEDAKKLLEKTLQEFDDFNKFIYA